MEGLTDLILWGEPIPEPFCSGVGDQTYGSTSRYGSGEGFGRYGDTTLCGDGMSSDESPEFEAYWQAGIDTFAKNWPEYQRQRLAAVRQEGAVLAFWWSDSKGHPCNGGFYDAPAYPGMFQVVEGPLRLCSERALHATMAPPGRYNGTRLWVVALHGETRRVHDGKIGALQREILGECVE
jgi:hypothetical protein